MLSTVLASASCKIHSNNLIWSKCSVSSFPKSTWREKVLVSHFYRQMFLYFFFCSSSFHIDQGLHLWSHLLVLSFHEERPPPHRYSFSFSFSIAEDSESLQFAEVQISRFVLRFYSSSFRYPALILSKYMPVLNHK